MKNSLLLRLATRVKLEFLIGMIILLVGCSLVAFPDKGVIGWLSNLIGIPGQAPGVIIAMSGGLIMGEPDKDWFIIYTFPFMFYIVASVLYYFLNQPTTPTYIIIYVGFYLLMLRVYQQEMGA